MQKHSEPSYAIATLMCGLLMRTKTFGLALCTAIYVNQAEEALADLNLFAGFKIISYLVAGLSLLILIATIIDLIMVHLRIKGTKADPGLKTIRICNWLVPVASLMLVRSSGFYQVPSSEMIKLFASLTALLGSLDFIFLAEHPCVQKSEIMIVLGIPLVWIACQARGLYNLNHSSMVGKQAPINIMQYIDEYISLQIFLLLLSLAAFYLSRGVSWWRTRYGVRSVICVKEFMEHNPKTGERNTNYSELAIRYLNQTFGYTNSLSWGNQLSTDMDTQIIGVV